jgi:hypothetical protein
VTAAHARQTECNAKQRQRLLARSDGEIAQPDRLQSGVTAFGMVHRFARRNAVGSAEAEFGKLSGDQAGYIACGRSQ